MVIQIFGMALVAHRGLRLGPAGMWRLLGLGAMPSFNHGVRAMASRVRTLDDAALATTEKCLLAEAATLCPAVPAVPRSAPLAPGPRLRSHARAALGRLAVDSWPTPHARAPVVKTIVNRLAKTNPHP